MQYLRTASGSFINAASITLLTPERGDGDAIKGWVATCRDGLTVALAPYFTLPGRIVAVLDCLPAPIIALAGRTPNSPVLPEIAALIPPLLRRDHEPVTPDLSEVES